MDFHVLKILFSLVREKNILRPVQNKRLLEANGATFDRRRGRSSIPSERDFDALGKKVRILEE